MWPIWQRNSRPLLIGRPELIRFSNSANKSNEPVIYSFGIPYGNLTRVAAMKEKRFTGIQRKPAAMDAR
jgi:hypothetical protein